MAILGGVCDARAASLVDRGLADDSPAVRAAALHAGGANELVDIVPRAQKPLGDESAAVRRAAILTLIEGVGRSRVAGDGDGRPRPGGSRRCRAGRRRPGK